MQLDKDNVADNKEIMILGEQLSDCCALAAKVLHAL